MIQIGADRRRLLYFRQGHLADRQGLGQRLFQPEYRGHFDHRFGWYIIVGSIPIGVVGFLGKDVISGPSALAVVGRRSLIVLERGHGVAERVAKQDRVERDLTMLDAVLVGPGPVRRAGARRLPVRRDDLRWVCFAASTA